jgi:hypothetical protein
MAMGRRTTYRACTTSSWFPEYGVPGSQIRSANVGAAGFRDQERHVRQDLDELSPCELACDRELIGLREASAGPSQRDRAEHVSLDPQRHLRRELDAIGELPWQETPASGMTKPMHRWCTSSDTRRGAGCSARYGTRVDPQRELAEVTRDEGLVADLAEANGEVESVAYEIDLAIVDLHASLRDLPQALRDAKLPTAAELDMMAQKYLRVSIARQYLDDRTQRTFVRDPSEIPPANHGKARLGPRSVAPLEHSRERHQRQVSTTRKACRMLCPACVLERLLLRCLP